MEPEQQLAMLKMLVDSAPDLASQMAPFPRETHIWLGRLHAVLDDQGSLVDAAILKSAITQLSGPYIRGKNEAANEIMGVLYRAVAEAEVNSPAGATGSFIPVGNTFDALQAVSKILSGVSTQVLIVDPYMDETVLTEYALLAPENASVRLLSDEKSVKPGLAPAAKAWREQYATARPLDVRLSPPKSLHDRLILVDNKAAWVLTQSLKDFAQRSPASLTLSDEATSKLKIDAYEELWSRSKEL